MSHLSGRCALFVAREHGFESWTQLAQEMAKN